MILKRTFDNKIQFKVFFFLLVPTYRSTCCNMAADGESVGTYGDHEHILNGHLSMGSSVSKTFGNIFNRKGNYIEY